MEKPLPVGKQLSRPSETLVCGRQCNVSGDRIAKIPENTFLYTEKEYGVFRVPVSFPLIGDPKTGMINSGIQYRSQVKMERWLATRLYWQRLWGAIYDENRRGNLLAGISAP
jgi:hypothetical protein